MSSFQFHKQENRCRWRRLCDFTTGSASSLPKLNSYPRRSLFRPQLTSCRSISSCYCLAQSQESSAGYLEWRLVSVKSDCRPSSPCRISTKSASWILCILVVLHTSGPVGWLNYTYKSVDFLLIVPRFSKPWVSEIYYISFKDFSILLIPNVAVRNPMTNAGMCDIATA
jgi:hypothetical protein